MIGFHRFYVKEQYQERLMIHIPKCMCLNPDWLKVQFLGRCYLTFIFARLQIY